MEAKGLRVNAGKTKVMQCRGEQGFRVRILVSIHVVFAGRELVTTQSDAWSVLGGFTRDVGAYQES